MLFRSPSPSFLQALAGWSRPLPPSPHPGCVWTTALFPPGVGWQEAEAKVMSWAQLTQNNRPIRGFPKGTKHLQGSNPHSPPAPEPPPQGQASCTSCLSYPSGYPDRLFSGSMSFQSQGTLSCFSDGFLGHSTMTSS